MKRSIAKKLKELRLYWKNYVFQSLFATLVIFAVLLGLRFQEVVIIASIGSTAFIVFAMPNSVAAKPVNIIGGQLVGFACGYLCGLIPLRRHKLHLNQGHHLEKRLQEHRMLIIAG